MKNVGEFTWIETYNEISNWLCDKENKQKELISCLHKIGIKTAKDNDQNQNKFELDEIDPFTFFAYLNKYYSNSTRINILKRLHEELNLQCDIPKDVCGIPTSYPLKVWFFPYKYLRGSNNIKTLWELFHQIRLKNVDNNTYKEALKIKSTGISKLTISFFYINPKVYLPLDSRTTSFLQHKGINYNKRDIENDFKKYLDIIEEAKNSINLNPFEISQLAYNKHFALKESRSEDNKINKDIAYETGTLQQNGCEEGESRKKKTSSTKKNLNLMNSRKYYDNFTCQACGFHYNNIIVHAHHLTPFNEKKGLRISKIEELITLCPTCHALAHHILNKDKSPKLRNNVEILIKEINKKLKASFPKSTLKSFII